MHRGKQDTPTRVMPLPRSGGGRQCAACLCGVVVAALALRLFTTIAVGGAATAPASARPDDVVLLLLAWVGVALSAWLALGSLLGIATLLPGAGGRLAGQVAERVTPLAARKALTLLLGASVGSVALPPAPVTGAGSTPLPADTVNASTRPGAGPAEDSGTGSGSGPRGPVAARGAPTGPGFTPTVEDTGRAAAPVSTAVRPPVLTPVFLPTPDPTNPPPADRVPGPGYLPSAPARVLAADRSQLLAPTPRPTTAAHDAVTVHRGDSLWAVAARHLGPGASDAQIAREWPRWYAANRHVIGDDPDRLVPGQQLHPPTAHTSVTSSSEHTPTVPAERGAHR